MLAEVFDSREPRRTLLFGNGEQLLAAIIDGSSSWGTGNAAAEYAHDELRRMWDTASWSSSELVENITRVASTTPAPLRSDEFGWGFSLTALLCSRDLVEVVAAGLYRVDCVNGVSSTCLFKPTTVADKLRAHGELRTSETLNQAHGDVFIGPYVGDALPPELAVVAHRPSPGDRIFVTHTYRAEALLVNAQLPRSAAKLASLTRPGSPATPVIYVEYPER